MRIAVESQLAGNTYRQAVEYSEVLRCQVTLGEVNLLVAADLLCLRQSQHVVELGNQLLDSGDELDDTLRDDDSTEVVTVGSADSNSVGDVRHDVVEAHSLLLDLLGNEADVRLSLECALKGDVRSRATHHLDEVPVLAGRVTVALDVTDQLRVGLTSGIEAERGLNLRVLQVTVDGLRTTDHLHTILLGSIVLSQHTSVGVRVVTTDNHDSLDVELADDLQTLLELIDLLQLCTARADHVETASVAILVDNLWSQLHIVMINQTTRAEDETEETVLRVELLDLIEQTGNHVMTARSLTARKDDTNVHLGVIGLCCGLKLHDRHTVSVGEQLLDLFLVANTLSGLTFLDFYSTLQGLRQFRLISSPCNL